MDYDKYKSFAPYRGEDFDDGVRRLLNGVGYLGEFVTLLAGSGDEARTKAYFGMIMDNISKVRNYDDFQHNVTAGVLVPTIVKRTMTEFTVSGIEKIDPDKGYLFISNHRDIILDCALLDYALLTNGKPLCEMAFGDNLIINQFTEDLFRLNGGIVIRRELPMREKYIESIKVSEYFHALLTEEHKSIWIAQKSGRSKDGIDMTQSAIIKMLFLSQRSQKRSIREIVNELNIVPISISYEFDPNDINKGREEVMRKSHDGDYAKKKYEDLISMAKGMKCQKGRVHLAIGDPIRDADSAEDAAVMIDRQIHLSYRLWDTNLFAYDYLENTDRFADEYKDFDKDSFLTRFQHLNDDVRLFVLNSYANPVRMALKEKE